MIVECYIRIYGKDFDAVQFCQKTADLIKGAVPVQRDRSGTQWDSHRIYVEEGFGERELVELCSKFLESPLRELLPIAVQIDLVIYRKPILPSGSCSFYFTAELIKLLGRIGAGIDYDIYPCSEAFLNE